MGKGKWERLTLSVIFSFLKSKSEAKLECKYLIKQGNRYTGFIILLFLPACLIYFIKLFLMRTLLSMSLLTFSWNEMSIRRRGLRSWIGLRKGKLVSSLSLVISEANEIFKFSLWFSPSLGLVVVQKIEIKVLASNEKYSKISYKLSVFWSSTMRSCVQMFRNPDTVHIERLN